MYLGPKNVIYTIRRKFISDSTDLSKQAAVLRSRQLRNDIKHGSLKDFTTNAQFLKKWKDIQNILSILLDNKNFKSFQAFKTEDLGGFAGKAHDLMIEKIREGVNVSETNQKLLRERLKEIKEMKEWMEEWKTQSLGKTAPLF